MKIDLEILSTELLKPSTPTPHHLKSLKLSFQDQKAPPIYVPVSLFYTKNDDLKIPEIRTHLKSSLSETLTRFYPFAGRLKDQVSVDCNDEGVLYQEARAGCQLLETLENPDILLLDIFLPSKLSRSKEKSPALPLLGVQVNVFQCGGIVIGICFSHVIADAKSISTFLKSWGNTARGIIPPVGPDFTAGSALFPPRDDLHDQGMILPSSPESCGKFVTKRFLLKEKSLGRLKTKVATNTNPNPTRIQALSALVWERYNYIISKVPLGIDTSKFPSMILAVNLRPRADPPLPDSSTGNIVGIAFAQHDDEEGSRGRQLPELAQKVKKSFDSVDSQFIRYLQSDQHVETLKGLSPKGTAEEEEDSQSQKTNSVDSFIISSWCNMGIYEVDFGWGEPIWYSPAANMADTVIMLSRAIFCNAPPRNGKGIEAWLTLPAEQMAVLENDPHFLEFASLNPTILNF